MQLYDDDDDDDDVDCDDGGDLISLTLALLLLLLLLPWEAVDLRKQDPPQPFGASSRMLLITRTGTISSSSFLVSSSSLPARPSS